jgi:hypothetical protein
VNWVRGLARRAESSFPSLPVALDFTTTTMTSKRKAAAMNTTPDEESVDPSDELMFLCLGGGNEVGRSCHIIQYKGKTVMVRRFGFLGAPWSCC